MTLPLEGIRVLDLSRFLSGPYCTMVLADFGAEVLKLERPGEGDDSRRLSPRINGESYPFGMVNRNKKSLAVDLKQRQGLEIALELAAGSDVVVENFRPGVADRLGIGYEAVRERNDGIIYCSISGFGQTGPWRLHPGFDIIAQGMTGIMHMTGHPGQPPVKVGIAMNDVAAGMTAAHSIMAAYIGRTRTGRGQHIDISLVDAGLAWTVWEAGAYFGSGETPAATGTRHRRLAPYQAFRAADGYLIIAANTTRHWRSLCDALGRPEWPDDPRYRDHDSRLHNVDDLTADIETVVAERPVQHWLDALEEAGVPCGPVLTYEQAVAHEQVRARQMVTTMEHPRIGTMRTLGPPAKLSETPLGIRLPSPSLGQHTREVLTAQGYDDEAIAALLGAGTVAEDAGVPAAPPRRDT